VSLGKTLKGELGELELFFRKLPLHQQKFLVVSVLSNSPWPLVAKKFEKWTKIKLLSTFQWATLFYSNNARSDFLCLLRDGMN